MIGEKIKENRKKLNLTLAELSKRTNLSVGYLSNVERDVTSPTMDKLFKICEAMPINLLDLINDSMPFNPFIKKNERPLVYSSNYRLRYEYLTDINQKLVGKCQTFSKDHTKKECSWGHEKDEFGIVIKGSLEIEAYDKTFHLQEGDSIYIKAFTKHSIRKDSPDEAVCYWASVNNDYQF